LEGGIQLYDTSEHSSSFAKSFEERGLKLPALSVVRIAGVPKRDTQEEKKASATVSAVMSLRGWASGHFEKSVNHCQAIGVAI
ncbi:hypothetical protein TNCV_4446741, partial [Trichonephila clavipes]